MVERWREVVGWEGLYDVSDAGRIRSRTRSVRTKGGVRTLHAQIIKPRLNRGGYLQVSLSRNSRFQTKLIHRMVCEAFHGPAPEGRALALHWDGNRINNRADNLRWGNHSENMTDMARHGTGNSHWAKVTHCPQGHEYTEENTYINPGRGSRACRVCKTKHGRESWRRVHGKPIYD